MNVKFDWSGLDKLQRKIKALDGTHRISFDELFSAQFMRQHTRYGSFQELLDASDYGDMDFEDIPDAAWDQAIREHTSFASWKEMQNAAATKWAGKKLEI